MAGACVEWVSCHGVGISIAAFGCLVLLKAGAIVGRGRAPKGYCSGDADHLAGIVDQRLLCGWAVLRKGDAWSVGGRH